ncbi:hypothetical protein N7522_012781 [Penicillium canescens]|nr:hypothetical protein N7522_012781 [Penicillium canescens]
MEPLKYKSPTLAKGTRPAQNVSIITFRRSENYRETFSWLSSVKRKELCMWRVCENELLSERLPRPLDADQVI